MLDPIKFMKHVLAIRFGRRSDESGGEGRIGFVLGLVEEEASAGRSRQWG